MLRSVSGLAVAFACVAFSSPARGASYFSAGFEVILTDAADKLQIQTTTQVPVGEPIELAMGKYRVTMNIEEMPKKKYKLRVAVRDNSSGLNVGGRLLEEVFSGTLGSILEFETSAAPVALKGAIAISRIDR